MIIWSVTLTLIKVTYDSLKPMYNESIKHCHNISAKLYFILLSTLYTN